MQIRVANAADAAAIARVHVATWQAAYRGQIPDAILDALEVERRTARWLEILTQPSDVTFVAEAQNGLTGFCSLIPSRDPGVDARNIGEIAALYVCPKHWRKGIGGALCQRTFLEARERRFTAITLWVLKTNLPAISFYERLGFAPDGATKSDQLRDFTLNELRLARPL